MNSLAAFVELGFRHIVSIEAADHILFLVALAAIYTSRDWREVLKVITAFTVGHSVTLALAATGILTLPDTLIEFLIPVTIVLTCLENLAFRDIRPRSVRNLRPLLAGIFGLVHGAGFANYLRNIFADGIALPLFGFNVGIELGQVVALFGIAVVLGLFDVLLRGLKLNLATPHRIRVVTVSFSVLLVAGTWAIQRVPW